MTDEKENANPDPKPEEKKRKRKAPEKPFMVQVAIDVSEQLKDVKQAWVDIPLANKPGSSAEAWEMVAELEREGTYRVFQNCGEHELVVEKKTITTLK
jgi:hypothetical protein